jgi:hypothetical protein
MNNPLSKEQFEALAAMVELGQQDRTHYLETYAEENEESPEMIAAGRRQVELASEALAALRGDEEAPEATEAPVVTDVEDEGPGHLITISADFRVANYSVSDILEDASNDGIFSIPEVVDASFLSAEITADYAEDE